MITPPTTPSADLRAARADLARAERSLEEARNIAKLAGPDPTDPFDEAEQDQAIRVALAKRWVADATRAQAREERSRARRDRWRAILGRPPRVRDDGPPPDRLPVETAPRVSPEAAAERHRATVAMVEGQTGDHRTDEDLHPAVLDAHEEALDRALSDREKRVVEREARDA